MKLTLEPASESFTMAPGIKYRVYRGTTDRGVKIEAFITHIVPLPGQDESSLDELEVYPDDWHLAFQNHADFHEADCSACDRDSISPGQSQGNEKTTRV